MGKDMEYFGREIQMFKKKKKNQIENLKLKNTVSEVKIIRWT